MYVTYDNVLHKLFRKTVLLNAVSAYLKLYSYLILKKMNERITES